MTTWRWTAAVVIAAFSVVLAAPTSLGDTSRFKAQGCANDPHWEPGVRRITKGDRIVWKNPTQCEHTVTAWSGNWNKDTVLSPDESTRKRFRKAGTFKFRCMTTGHSVVQGGKCTGMCGRVRVTR